MSAILSPEDHRRIIEAIRRAEASTSGEIFVVVAAASADYRVLPLVWAGLAALLAGFLTAAIFPEMAAGSLALGQVLVLILVAGLLFIRHTRMILVPAALQQARARARASEQFLAHNLHTTRTRTGVLIFVSLAERHATILSDSAISARVPADFWERIIAGLTAEISVGHLGEAIADAVEACGRALAEHFPRQPNDRNDLPDRMIEI